MAPIRILHLEDDPLDAALIRGRLAAGGYGEAIEVVQTEAEFRRALAGEGLRLILGDYRLPGFDGLTALKIARQIRPETPFIFVSGEMGEERAIASLKAGAADYVLKDNLNRLLPALENALAQAEARVARGKAEEGMRDLALQWQSTFDAVSDPMFILGEDHRILRYNKAFAELIGAGHGQEILGRPCWEIVHGTETSIDGCPLDATLQSGKRAKIEIPLFGRWVEVITEPLASQNAHPHWGGVHIIRDITEQKAALEKIHLNEERNRKLAEESATILRAIPDVVQLLDKDLRILWGGGCGYNAGLGEDVAPKDVIGQVCYQAYFRAQAPCPKCPVLKTFAGQGDQEAVVKLPNGRTYSIRTIGLYVSDHEIRPHSDALPQSRKRLQGAPDAHPARGHKLKRPASYTSVCEQAADPHTGVNAADGVPCDRLPERVQTLARDVTEQISTEEQLRHAQKMESVGTLAGGIAHDFNNILSVIQGFSELLEGKLGPESPHQPMVGQILDASRRASRLVKGLLAFSRKREAEFKPVSLNHIVRTIEKMLRRLLGAEITLTVRCCPDDLIIEADSGHMDQVLMNFAANARDVLPAGGSIEIETERVSLDPGFISMHGFTGKAGDYALLRFRDNGAGMDEVTRKRIFDPFFTTKELGRGTGLGLSIVYGIIKQHGGCIDCESRIGEGTLFSVYLPLTGSALEQEKAAAAGRLQVGRTEKILLAEDDGPVRSILRMTLEEAGFQVTEVRDGVEAVEMIRGQPDRFQAVILDVVMPRKNGIEAYQEIRAIRPGQKVLFVTGYLPDETLRASEPELLEHFIYKPISPFDLIRRLTLLLDTDARERVGPSQTGRRQSGTGEGQP